MAENEQGNGEELYQGIHGTHGKNQVITAIKLKICD
jgi:hypothetical protein